IGFMWLAHHRMFHFVERGDGRLAALTLLLLLLVAFAPFPVALVGAHGDHVAPVVIYAITLGASNLVLGATWLYATWKRRLVPADLETSFIRYVSIRTFAVPIVFAISIPLAFLPHGPAIAERSWAAVF